MAAVTGPCGNRVSVTAGTRPWGSETHRIRQLSDSRKDRNLSRYGAMVSLLTRLLRSRVPPSSPPPDEEIPRYPPFAQGLPAAPVARILATQAELIDALSHTLALPDKDYRAILVPVLERYAAFTHLLPASEAHHHRQCC